MRLPVNLIKRSLHNSLNKSNVPLDMKTEYAHFLLSSTNCLLLCGTLYGLDEYNKNLKNINNKLPNLSMTETKE
ncbi:hypothetical protein N9O88_00135 [bacterium]|jgi:hypothetical protein|nr:hypothetical protein [bacterium]